MYRYEITLYGTKHTMNTYTTEDNHISGHWAQRYLQLLGFTKRDVIYSIWDLSDEDFKKLKSSNPVLIRTNGTTKILTTKVKEVRRVKL